MTDEPTITGMYELLDAIEAVVASADAEKRKALATTIDEYADDFAEDFYWATSGQAPALLHHLLQTIDAACTSPRLPAYETSGNRSTTRSKRTVSLSDRKPEGNT
jgi:hypothetical protein